MQDRDEASLLLFLAPLLILLALPLCAEECATVCYHFQLPMAAFAALRGKNFIHPCFVHSMDSGQFLVREFIAK